MSNVKFQIFRLLLRLLTLLFKMAQIFTEDHHCCIYIYTRKNTLWNHFNHLKTLSHTRAHLFHTDKSTFPLKNILFSNYFQLFSQTHRSSFDRSSPFILLLVLSLSLFSFSFRINLMGIAATVARSVNVCVDFPSVYIDIALATAVATVYSAVRHSFQSD